MLSVVCVGYHRDILVISSSTLVRSFTSVFLHPVPCADILVIISIFTQDPFEFLLHNGEGAQIDPEQ